MGIFTQVDEIENLVHRLDSLVKRRYREVVKRDAEYVASELIAQKGLAEVCRDLDDAIEEAEDIIHYTVETNVTYDFDNFLLATFSPYPESQEVDDEVIKEIACAENADVFVEKALQAYAFELWKVGVRNALKEILEERCKKAGLLARVAGLLR